MRIKMKQSGLPAGPDEIQGLEQALGRPLPAEYAEFLLLQNGGRPDPSRLVLARHPARACEVESFYGLGGDHLWQSLWWGLEAHRETMPDGFLPIAYTDEGHEICLVMRDESFGSVVLWDSNWDCGKEYWDNIYLVADSFVDFLALLAGGDSSATDTWSQAPGVVRKLH